MARLFVALELPSALRDALAHWLEPLAAAGVPGVRVVAPDNLHLTLKFLGAVDAAHTVTVVTALQAIAQAEAPVAVALSGLGAFPSPRRPRVLVAQVNASPMLGLQQRVDSAMAGLGFAAEQRPYHPHVTLARVRPAAREAASRLLAGHLGATAAPQPCWAHHVMLLESLLSAASTRYALRAHLPLEGAHGFR